jgi:hypothetical protein
MLPKLNKLVTHSQLTRKEMNHTRMIIAIAVPMILLLQGTVVITNHEVKAQSTGNDDVGKYLKGLTSSACKEKPRDIPTIVIPSNHPGKTGGITAFGNADAGHGNNGPISIGGNSNSGKSVPSSNSDAAANHGNGGVALCGSANGK